MEKVFVQERPSSWAPPNSFVASRIMIYGQLPPDTLNRLSMRMGTPTETSLTLELVDGLRGRWFHWKSAQIVGDLELK